MPVLSEDSGECPPPRLHMPGLAGLGGSEMEQNTKTGPVLWHCLWKLLPACPADLSLRGEGCCQGRMRELLREPSRTGSPTVCGPCFPASSSGLHETLALLTSQLRPDSNHREEMGFLRDVFSEKSLSYLMKVRACSTSFPVPEGGSTLGRFSHFPAL